MTGTERDPDRLRPFDRLRIRTDDGGILSISSRVILADSVHFEGQPGYVTLTLLADAVEVLRKEPETTQAEPIKSDATVRPGSDLPFWCNQCQARYAGPHCLVIGHDGDLPRWADPYDQNRPLSDFPFWCEQCGRARAANHCGVCGTANRARRA